MDWDKLMQLYKHQKRFLSDNPSKSSLVWSCGTGKSRTACEWSRLHLTPVLIICPKALVSNWKRECEKWNVQEPSIITKEEFRKYFKKIPAFSQVIVDEVHNGFLTPGFKSQMSKSLRWYLKEHKVPRVLLLSATVYTSSPWNIYNLAWLTGHEWNWQKFKFEFFDDVWMGNRQIPVVKKGSEKKLAELTKQIASVVDIHDCMDVPEQLHCEPEYFALTKEQEKAIKENYDPTPIVRYTQQHEIENGILLGNEFKESQTFKYDKMDRIKELVAENKKVAIVCRYHNQIDELWDGLADCEKQVYVISGKIANRDAICLSAEKLDECIVIIQADCGIGFQLPSFELCIYVSQSYSYTSWEQMNGRFLRMDKPSRTTFMYLLTDANSVDKSVYKCIRKKEDFKIELYGK